VLVLLVGRSRSARRRGKSRAARITFPNSSDSSATLLVSHRRRRITRKLPTPNDDLLLLMLQLAAAAELLPRWNSTGASFVVL
jgi:hypothetical protein